MEAAAAIKTATAVNNVKKKGNDVGIDSSLFRPKLNSIGLSSKDKYA